MAISTYAELQAAVASWLTRVDLTARIPDFITLAESGLNRRLRLRMMETVAALTVADQGTSVALPAGFVEPIALWEVTSQGNRLLRYLAPGQINTLTSSGRQIDWTITGSQIVFPRPTAGVLNLSFEYLKSFALSDDAPTNWLLTNHPDAYLFAALLEAAPYLRDSEALSIWSQRLEKSLTEIMAKEDRSRSLATLTTNIAGRMPRRRGYYDNSGYGLDG